MREATSGKKETNATKKYYFLQHQNKATATTEQSAMREAISEKRTLMQQRNITCCNIKTRLLQCEMQHQKQKKRLIQQRNITFSHNKTRLQQRSSPEP
jgi:hypothetical protein